MKYLQFLLKVGGSIYILYGVYTETGPFTTAVTLVALICIGILMRRSFRKNK